MNKVRALGLCVASAIFCSAPLSPQLSPTEMLHVSVDMADARIGRPLTPFSVAGVHRRIYRRAYYGAGAYSYGRYGHWGFAYGHYGFSSYGGGYDYGDYGSSAYDSGYNNYGYADYGYSAGYGSYGYASYGYPAYSVGIPVVVAPVLAYPSIYTYGYSGCDC